jgi:hypothetical protein
MCMDQEIEIKQLEASDLLCGLVARVPGFSLRSPGFDSRRCQIFWVAVVLERGPISLVKEKIRSYFEEKLVAAV